MFQAASKESSPPASVSASAPVGSSVSSQAATLRVTSEGLNIVGDGGVLGIGKKSSSQKEQKQKFFATRSADGNWNLLVAPSSDPSRLFLVQPAPGHKFQMTGGKGSMERMDTAAESKSANGASSNGYEEDLSVMESVEQSPGTSKSFAVPVAQLKASSSISPVSTSHTTIASAPGEVETTAASDGSQDFPTPREQKKPTFFKSRTAKDREALKASAHHVLGKKVIFINKRSGKTGGTSQVGHSAKQGRKSKSVGSPKFNKNIPVSVTQDERTSQSVSGSCHVPAVSSSICVCSGDVSTIVSPSLQSYTSSTHSSSSGAIGGEAASVFNSGSSASSSSPSRNFISDMSCSDHLLTPTPEQHGVSNSQNNSVGNEYNKTNVNDTRNKTPDQQSKMLNNDDICCGAGDKSVCSSPSAGQCKSRPLLDHHGNSEDGQKMENSASYGDACVLVSEADGLMGISSLSDINSSAELSEEISTVVCQSIETFSGMPLGRGVVKDGAKASALDSGTANAVENSMLTSVCKSQSSDAASSETSLDRRQQKTAVGKECSDFSSDTDDYEFVLFDKDEIIGGEKSSADTVAQTTSDKGSSRLKLPTDKCDTETFTKNPTAKDNRVTENPTEQVSVKESDGNRMAEKDTSASVSLRTNVGQICSEQSDNPSRTNGSIGFLSSRTFENTKCIQQNQKGLKTVEADSRDEENSGDIESAEGFHPNLPASRAVDDGGDQTSSQNEERLFQNTGMPFVGDCDSVASETTQEVQEAAHAQCASSEEQQVRGKKRRRRKSILDCIAEEPNEKYHTVVFKSKAKKRKKRKSELENLMEMQVAETDVQGIPEGEGGSEQEPGSKIQRPGLEQSSGSEIQRPGSEVQGPVSEAQESGSELKECGSKVCGSDIPGPGSEIQGCGSKEQEFGSAVQESGTEVQEPGSKEQEFGSEVQGPGSKEQELGSEVQEPGTVGQGPGSKEQHLGSEVQEPGTVVQGPGSGKVCASAFHSGRPEKGNQETKKWNKKKKKKNVGFIQIDALPAAGSGDTGSSSCTNVSQLMDVANCGPPLESVSQCLPHADQNVCESGQRLTSEDATVSVGQNSDTHRLEEEMVREVQTLGQSVEKAKKKKKKKKLKIVFGNGQETTREIPASVSIDDLGPVSECETGSSVTHLQNVSLPDVDNNKQTGLSGDSKQKKKRKKRLSELETLIHDQEAYALHLDTTEESETTSTFEMSAGHNVDMTVDDAHREAEAKEKSTDEVPHELGATESDQSKERCSSNGSGVVTTETARKDAEPSSASTTEVADSLQVGRLYAASEQQAKKDVLHTVKSKVDKTKKKKKRKKQVTTGVAMPPVTLGLDIDTAKGEKTIEKGSMENTDTTTGKHFAEKGSTENTDSTVEENSVEKGSLENTDTVTGEKSEEKGSLEETDLNCSLSDDTSLSEECNLSIDVLSDSESEDEVTEANKAMKRFLTTRSFGKWELARMFGSPFVVLERLSEQDVYFMSRRFRNARVSSRARCTVHCRLRTLGYLCRLKLIDCKPPPSSIQDVSDKQEDAASNAAGEPVSKKKTKKKKVPTATLR